MDTSIGAGPGRDHMFVNRQDCLLAGDDAASTAHGFVSKHDLTYAVYEGDEPIECQPFAALITFFHNIFRLCSVPPNGGEEGKCFKYETGETSRASPAAGAMSSSSGESTFGASSNTNSTRRSSRLVSSGGVCPFEKSSPPHDRCRRSQPVAIPGNGACRLEAGPSVGPEEINGDVFCAWGCPRLGQSSLSSSNQVRRRERWSNRQTSYTGLVAIRSNRAPSNVS